jgi:hypothetical protein
LTSFSSLCSLHLGREFIFLLKQRNQHEDYTSRPLNGVLSVEAANGPRIGGDLPDECCIKFNGSVVLSDFDILTEAGAKYIAIREFKAVEATGLLRVELVPQASDKNVEAIISGFEVALEPDGSYNPSIRPIAYFPTFFPRQSLPNCDMVFGCWPGQGSQTCFLTVAPSGARNNMNRTDERSATLG